MRAQVALALLLTLPICACAPKPEAAAATAVALDCAMPFDAQSARLTAQPHLVPAAHAPGEPYAYYSTDDGHASYLITLKGAPGYPAILMQQASGGQVKTTGCSYGDRKGYKQLMAYLDSLKTWTRR
ncbi:MAG: hypothetical protein ACXU8S_02590 [Phenylobacterium sp.]